VLCVPDVVANSGAVICAAAEYRGAGHAEAFTEIREKIRDSTAELPGCLRRAPVTPRPPVRWPANGCAGRSPCAAGSERRHGPPTGQDFAGSGPFAALRGRWVPAAPERSA
jgi:hypothetical protein